MTEIQFELTDNRHIRKLYRISPNYLSIYWLWQSSLIKFPAFCFEKRWWSRCSIQTRPNESFLTFKGDPVRRKVEIREEEDQERSVREWNIREWCSTGGQGIKKREEVLRNQHKPKNKRIKVANSDLMIFAEKGQTLISFDWVLWILKEVIFLTTSKKQKTTGSYLNINKYWRKYNHW